MVWNTIRSTKNKYKDSVFVNDEGKRFVKEEVLLSQVCKFSLQKKRKREKH